MFFCISCTKNGILIYIWSLTPQLEILRAESQNLVARRPLQYIHCTEQGFYGTASENQFILLLPVIQFCVIHFKTLLYAKSYNTFTAVCCSSFLHSFLGLALTSFCTRVTWALRFSLQLSMCRWNPYMEWSLPTNLPAGLLVWPYTWISILALSSNPSATFSWKISSKIFFLLVLSCMMCALTTTMSNRWKESFFHHFIVFLSNE